MQRTFILTQISNAAIITVICLFVYASVQQTYRTAANDPQIEIASVIKQRLEKSKSIESIFPKDTVDLENSLSLFVTVYNDNGQPMHSTGFINGAMPVLPAGVFDFTKANGEDRITWQPQHGVRLAMVVRKVNLDKVNFVAVGRSLNEIEVRESNLLSMTFICWIICMAIISINAAVYFFIGNKKNQ